MSGTLELQDVSRAYGPVVALHKTSLTIEQGSFFALLGPSGCGKTTTLRIIAGFESPDSGSVLIDGIDVRPLPPNKRKLGMVFQDYALFPHMNVAENVGFGLRMAGVGRCERERRIKNSLATVHLSQVEERLPHELSGGQRQRVALARSVITNPEVLLLDEPLSALDKNLRENMQFELKRLQRELGITTVMVTHDQEEALTLSDKIAVMEAGRVQQVGRSADVYDSPHNRFVADFLGAANMFTGARTSHDKIKLTTDEHTIDIALHPNAPSSKLLTVGVRPEKVLLSREKPMLDTALECRVLAEVFRGPSRAYEVRHPAIAEPILAYAQASDRLSSDLPSVGETLWIGWNAPNSFVFEAVA